jgi:hypothetical protein
LGSKESWKNTEEKVGLRQSFRGQIKTNVIFPLNFEENTQKKYKKLKNFEFLLF